MSHLHTCDAVPASQAAMAPFGRLIELRNGEPSKQGHGWKCWGFLGYLECGGPVDVGVVSTASRSIIVEAMERHTSREELLWPTDSPIVQPLAAGTGPDASARPVADSVQALIVHPGQALIIGRGTWHSPAYPLADDTLYFFAIEAAEDSVDYGDQPWVPFDGGKKLLVSTGS